MSAEEMRRCGLSKQKEASLRDLSERVMRKELSFRRIDRRSDEEILEMFCQVRGIGVWTVQMFRIFALQRSNVLATGDLAIRSAVRQAYALKELPKPLEMAQLAENWQPFCSVACWYFWRSPDGVAAL